MFTGYLTIGVIRAPTEPFFALTNYGVISITTLTLYAVGVRIYSVNLISKRENCHPTDLSRFCVIHFRYRIWIRV